MGYYLNHYIHKLTKEEQFRKEWLKSKEEFLISDRGLMVAHPPASSCPDQGSSGRRRRSWGKEEEKIKPPLSSTKFLFSISMKYLLFLYFML